MGWSSAITMRISPAIARPPVANCRQKELDTDYGALAGRGVDGGFAAQQLHPLGDAGESKAALRRAAGSGRKSFAIVADGQAHTAGCPPDGDAGFGGLGVLDDIVQSFLHDAV